MKKPTIEEISEYMRLKEFFYIEEAEAFFDHFESNGWKVGKNSMKNWQAAVRTWIRNFNKWSKPNEARKPSNHADRQWEAANRAMREIEEMESRDREVSIRLVRSSS